MDSTSSANQAHNQHLHQHRRQEISSDPLPALPGSTQETCVHSSRLCTGCVGRTATATRRPPSPSTSPSPTTTAKASSAPTSLYCESNRHVAHQRKSHKASGSAPVRVRSRPFWGSLVPVLLLQLILVLSTFVMNEAAMDDNEMMQWSIGEFQLDLMPTPEPLNNVDNVVAPSIERVVRSAMQRQFAESFLYMYVASLGRAQEQPATGRQGQDESFTSLYYNGGVVAFETPPSTTNINAIVKASIEANLAKELNTYGEPWSWIQSVTVVGLQNNPDTGADVDVDVDAPPPAPGSGPTPTTSVRTTPLPTPAPVSDSNPPPPSGGVSAIEGDGGDNPDTTQSEDKASAPQIVASGFGIAFVMIGATLFIKSARNRHTHVREVALSLEEADSEASVEGGEGRHKDLDADPATSLAVAAAAPNTTQDGNSRPKSKSTNSRGSRSRGSGPRAMGGGGESAAYVFEDNTDDEERSEMAQYSTGEWMESTSVAQSVTSSDFTLTTLDDATYSALADTSITREHSPRTSSSSLVRPDTSSRVAVMGFASSETFERDRLVTLHKDMLQSEWGTPLATHGHITYATNTSNTSNTTIRAPGGATSMSFEEAYQGDGDEPREEVYILPPPPSTTSQSRRKNDNKN